MVRTLLCEKCGVLTPMHPEDVAEGWKRRRIHGLAKKPAIHQIKTITKMPGGESKTTVEGLPILICDDCCQELPDGTPAIAVTMWREDKEGPPLDWESEYLNLTDL